MTLRLIHAIVIRASKIQFSCPSYATHRATLVTCVIEVLQRNNLNHLGNHLQLYLYGQDSRSHIDNRAILLSTIKYIKGARRFSTEGLLPLPPPHPTPNKPLFCYITFIIFSLFIFSFSMCVCACWNYLLSICMCVLVETIFIFINVLNVVNILGLPWLWISIVSLPFSNLWTPSNHLPPPHTHKRTLAPPPPRAIIVPSPPAITRFSNLLLIEFALLNTLESLINGERRLIITWKYSWPDTVIRGRPFIYLFSSPSTLPILYFATSRFSTCNDLLE